MSPSATSFPPVHQSKATKPGATGHAHDHRRRPSTQSVFLLLLALRIVNALTLRTFFQPDEYFQSLEPAWQIVFGKNSGAWVTWEWRAQLRSSLHPAVFAAVYQAVASFSSLCNLSLPFQAELLIAAPKVTQAGFAALLDCYTWKLANNIYGLNTRTSFVALALSVCSPWQWFCSTRTLSNCLETTITTIAVYHWPWHWPGTVQTVSVKSNDARDKDSRDQINKPSAHQAIRSPLSQLRLSLLLAAMACILRPTNILIWLCISIPTVLQAPTAQVIVLLREIVLCGSAVFACSLLPDRLYYGIWTVPPIRFLYLNIVRSLAVFYGRNRHDYYLTEGLPLLLTTVLPFAIVGVWQAVRKVSSNTPGIVNGTILKRLAWTTIWVTLAMSLIAHKEVRFLYPVLPFLHVIAARPVSSFFTPLKPSRKVILMLLLIANVFIAGYTSQVHQRGVIDAVSYLRHKHETGGATTTVGFLMPCHSTPWRSHFVHPSIEAWALTCEPPLDVPLHKRDRYLDEADQFYLNPGVERWLTENMEDLRTVSGSQSQMHWARLNPTRMGEKRRPWPQNLVFFEQLEPALRKYLRQSNYRECWRGFNTHFHDDWRRQGDVIVWCFDRN